MFQQFIFPIAHSIHTLQPINISSDYRFTFCFAIVLKVVILLQCEPPPLSCWGRLNLLANFQKVRAWQFLKGVNVEDRGNLYQGVITVFTQKINYNLKYLMTKKGWCGVLSRGDVRVHTVE